MSQGRPFRRDVAASAQQPLALREIDSVEGQFKTGATFHLKHRKYTATLGEQIYLALRRSQTEGQDLIALKHEIERGQPLAGAAVPTRPGAADGVAAAWAGQSGVGPHARPFSSSARR
jgi:hypothetical protein